jgi:hypothetical protein
MKRTNDRGVSGREAPMVITPRMLARLVRQMATSIRAAATRRGRD